MKTNQDYKNAALASLKGNWAPAVVCMIVIFIVSIATSLISVLLQETSYDTLERVSSVVSMLVTILITAPLSIGCYQSFMALFVEGDNNMTSNMFNFTFKAYGRVVLAAFLQNVLIVLWTLLFIIPGIIKSFAYMLTPFILKDYTDITPNQAIDLSQKMMKGHKFDAFWLMLSFIGWGILGVFTFGLGYLWLLPYMYTSLAAFYEDVKKEYIENTTL